jgi:radical SAM protein with 4Fe4S-binding SPASM domain
METKPTVIWHLDAKGGHALSTYEAYRTIDEIASIDPARFIIESRGRADLDQLIEYARRRKLEPALHLDAVTRLEIDHLQRFGLMRVIVDIDDATPDPETLNAIAYARMRRVAVEINTRVTKDNMADLAAIVANIEPFDIAAWNVDFGVAPDVTPADAEQIFAFIAAATSARKFAVRAVEAPHYMRYLLQGWSDFSGCVPSLADENATVVIDAAGEVHPGRSLPVAAGNVRYRPLKAIYRTGDLFMAMRDPRNLKGKCGRCEYRTICGGSRARAWTMTGDLFAADPLCAYQP